jgi:hypothetical protein
MPVYGSFQIVFQWYSGKDSRHRKGISLVLSFIVCLRSLLKYLKIILPKGKNVERKPIDSAIYISVKENDICVNIMAGNVSNVLFEFSFISEIQILMEETAIFSLVYRVKLTVFSLFHVRCSQGKSGAGFIFLLRDGP